MIDFKSLARYALSSAESLLSTWLPGGQVVGNEYKSVNPVRGDKSPGSFSVNISTGRWADFSPAANGAKGGDLISLYAYLNNMDNGQAYRDIHKLIGINKPAPRQNKPENYTIVFPVPDNAPPVFDVRKIKRGNDWIEYPITHKWIYRTITGEPYFYTCRYETPEGKEVLPLSLWKLSDGKLKWRWKHLPDIRPLYNLDRINADRTAQIIVVEGEKCAETLQSVIDAAGVKLIVTTWSGGGKAVHKTDWAPIDGRQVLLWPDFDLKNDADGKLLPEDKQPGYVAIRDIARIYTAMHNNKPEDIRYIHPVQGKFDGWDVADAILVDGWKFNDIIGFIKQHRREIPESWKPEPMPEYSDGGDCEFILPDEHQHETDTESDTENIPFKFLGYNDGIYYYLPHGSKQVRPIRGEHHNQAHLVMLADISFWENRFPAAKSGADWPAIANWCIRCSERAGVYTMSKMRGTGAWYDEGRVVLHLGNKLIVDNVETDVFKIQSEYVYPMLDVIERKPGQPIPNTEAIKIREIMSMIPWEKPIYSVFAAGWTMLAPVCGALDWRPHLWITGPAGSGKTTVLNLINQCLGDTVKKASSITSAAGIRQSLKNCANPITIDEFDLNDKRSAGRTQDVLELARQSSSETKTTIIKGSQSGTAIQYMIRSCFLFSSIQVSIGMHADETRITVCTLRKNSQNAESQAKYAVLKSKIKETLTHEFTAGLRARAIKLIPIIRQNAETFAQAVTDKIQSRRSGDQIGALLAGAYALSSDKAITLDAAIKWVSEQDWSEQQETADAGGDERTVLDAIMTHTVVINPSKKLTISEMLEVSNKTEFTKFDPPEDYLYLLRSGISLDKDTQMIYISDSHKEIRKMLNETPYQTGWGRLLSRLPNAERIKSCRFTGTITRAVGIPWNVVFQDGNESEYITVKIKEDEGF